MIHFKIYKFNNTYFDELVINLELKIYQIDKINIISQLKKQINSNNKYCFSLIIQQQKKQETSHLIKFIYFYFKLINQIKITSIESKYNEFKNKISIKLQISQFIYIQINQYFIKQNKKRKKKQQTIMIKFIDYFLYYKIKIKNIHLEFKSKQINILKQIKNNKLINQLIFLQVASQLQKNKPLIAKIRLTGQAFCDIIKSILIINFKMFFIDNEYNILIGLLTQNQVQL
ncbi:hypothetical protein TTHERM_000300488 (macronuclear) [Tetrahymena thermophila SB210]|uniref:Uncharacterized protein n=1 Tax=Tetrahymena thermophila (strain SB210) TaxID=312017 RepID=W7X343_TETTS|nr:hypothetical protein TTHERM_000300488 [Tetrahymena thermophila SB210]EWS71867.1 hypothetical protein TTHERM_000300488 [Tetrahymena thermophila SB210]|eukprot:XP_012655611.1 hypothetical protein TTHERM_000300488 [Tetrahymena thermophila SB210]